MQRHVYVVRAFDSVESAPRAADGDVKPGLGFSEVGNSKIEVPEAQEVTPVGPAYL